MLNKRAKFYPLSLKYEKPLSRRLAALAPRLGARKPALPNLLPLKFVLKNPVIESF